MKPMSPLTVSARTSWPSTRSSDTSPETLRALTSPCTPRTSTSPLVDMISRWPRTSDAWTSPDTLSICTSPLPQRRMTPPETELRFASPHTPLASTSAEIAWTSSGVLPGTVIVKSTSPSPRRGTVRTDTPAAEASRLTRAPSAWATTRICARFQVPIFTEPDTLVSSKRAPLRTAIVVSTSCASSAHGASAVAAMATRAMIGFMLSSTRRGQSGDAAEYLELPPQSVLEMAVQVHAVRVLRERRFRLADGGVDDAQALLHRAHRPGV